MILKMTLCIVEYYRGNIIHLYIWYTYLGVMCSYLLHTVYNVHYTLYSIHRTLYERIFGGIIDLCTEIYKLKSWNILWNCK